VDFRHLRAFIAVADESSVTKAAARLHISQPPLSRHIRQLEDELGVKLFRRHRMGVTLTDIGCQLLAKARILETAASDFLETAGHAVHEDLHTVRIGIGWGLWEPVHRVRIKSAKQSERLTIDAVDAFCADDYNEQLRNGSLDVVFGRPPFDETTLNVAPLFHERILAAVSTESPLAARKSVRIRDLASEALLLWDRHLMPHVYDKVLDLYAKAGITPRTIPTPGAGPHNHRGLMLVASGQGAYLCIGIPLTSPQPASGIALLPLEDADATVDICVAWRKDEAAPAVLQFMDAVWQVFPQQSGRPPLRATSPKRRAS
jgi:DNA-binding transcriptional LysR family regulator